MNVNRALIPRLSCNQWALLIDLWEDSIPYELDVEVVELEAMQLVHNKNNMLVLTEGGRKIVNLVYQIAAKLLDQPFLFFDSGLAWAVTVVVNKSRKFARCL